MTVRVCQVTVRADMGCRWWLCDFFFQAKEGNGSRPRSRGLGSVYKGQPISASQAQIAPKQGGNPRGGGTHGTLLILLEKIVGDICGDSDPSQCIYQNLPTFLFMPIPENLRTPKNTPPLNVPNIF